MKAKELNTLLGRPALQVICGYEFAALNSGGRLRAITSFVWWLRDHDLDWLAWLAVVPFLGWAGWHLLLEPTGHLTLAPQEDRGPSLLS